MKKTILIILVSIVALTMYSQTEKGTLVMGTELQFYNRADVNTSSDYSSNQTNINTSPHIGYFIANNLEIGVFYLLSNYKYNNEYNSSSSGYSTISKENTHLFGINSKYHKQIYNGLYLFNEIKAGYGFVNNESEKTNNSYYNNAYYVETSTQEGFCISSELYFGFEYYIKNRFGIELKFKFLNYQYESLTEKNTYYTNSPLYYLPSNYLPEEFKREKSNLSFSSPTISIGFKYNLINKKSE